MASETIFNLNNNKFEQESGEILSFSGCNKIFGQLNIENSGSINSDNNYKISGQTFISSGVNDLKTIKIGCGITSNDNNNIVIGADSIVTGNTSIGIGYYSCSINTNSIAIGCFSRSYGISDISIGTQATTIGCCSSIAIGFFSCASSDYNISLGRQSFTTEKGAISIGRLVSAENSGSTVIGGAICNTVSKSVGFGWYFDTTQRTPPILFAQESCSYIDGNDPILAIGHKDGNARIDIIATGSTCGFRLKDNNEGLNKVLISDVNGYGTWGDITTSSERIYKTISQSSHGFSVNDYIGWSGGTYNKAIADGTYDGEFIGLVTNVPDSNTFEVTYAGYVSGLTGLVQNTTYFLSETIAGELKDTPPTGLTEIIKAIIIADSTTSGWVLSYPGIEISTGSTATITGATNGLSVSGLDVVLGGPLTGNTTISGLGSNNLEFNGGLLKYSSNYTSSIGPRDIPDAEWVTGNTGGGTVNGAVNGLTLSGDKIILGGNLTGDTVISGGSSHDLCIVNSLKVIDSSVFTTNGNPFITSGGTGYDGRFFMHGTSNYLGIRAVGDGVNPPISFEQNNGTTNSVRACFDSTGAFCVNCNTTITGDLELTCSARNQEIFLTRTDSGNNYCFSICGGSSLDCQVLAIYDCKDGSSNRRLLIDCSGQIRLCNNIEVHGDVNVYEPGGPDGFKMCWNDTEQSIDFVIN